MARTRVILLPSPTMTTCRAWSALKRKRRTLWHNAARNALVARVGLACLGQDKKTLKKMGIPCKKRKQGVWTHRVVILVENTEHAGALGALLPGWELRDTVLPQEPVDDDAEEEGMPFHSGCVVTWMHAVRHNIRASYLIRGTGWRGRIELGGEDSWLTPPHSRLIVVDFADEWDVQAHRDTEARVREYQEQGLEVIDNTESPARS
jgi:hypothetical protein